MKKILFMLALLIFPLVVFADGAGPYVREYEASVKNPNGAELYTSEGKKTNIVAPRDHMFEVYMEEIIDGEYYVDVEYKEEYYLCKASDLALKEDSLKPDDDEKMEEPTKYYTYKTGGYLYKGPSKIYDKVFSEEIPVGTILTTKYYSSAGWVYVTYNNKSGWIFIYSKNDRSNPYPDDTSFARFTDETLITVPGSKLTDDSDNVIGTITDFTEVKINYYTGYIGAYAGYGKYNINYKGQTGWVEVGADLADEYNSIYIHNNTKLTDYDGNQIATVFKDTELKYTYKFFNDEGYPTFYVEYKNQKGFISGWDDLTEEWSTDDQKYVINSDDYFDLYDKPNGRVINNKSTSESFSVKYYFDEEISKDKYVSWVYAIVDDFKGWIKVDDMSKLNSYDNGSYNDLDDDYWDTPTYDDDYWDEYYYDYEEDDGALLDDEATVHHTGLDPFTLSEYCILGSIALTLTSFVTMTLINKKKKDKNPPVNPDSTSKVDEEVKPANPEIPPVIVETTIPKIYEDTPIEKDGE